MKLIKVKCKDAGTKVYKVEYNYGYVPGRAGVNYSIAQIMVEATGESNAKAAAMKIIKERNAEFRSIELSPFETLEQFRNKYPHSNYLQIKAN